MQAIVAKFASFPMCSAKPSAMALVSSIRLSPKDSKCCKVCAKELLPSMPLEFSALAASKFVSWALTPLTSSGPKPSRYGTWSSVLLSARASLVLCCCHGAWVGS